MYLQEPRWNFWWHISQNICNLHWYSNIWPHVTWWIQNIQYL